MPPFYPDGYIRIAANRLCARSSATNFHSNLEGMKEIGIPSAREIHSGLRRFQTHSGQGAQKAGGFYISIFKTQQERHRRD
jgi:hypothetical protein